MFYEPINLQILNTIYSIERFTDSKIFLQMLILFCTRRMISKVSQTYLPTTYLMLKYSVHVPVKTWFLMTAFYHLSKCNPGPMPAECSITDEELVTYNVKELNRVLKTKGNNHSKS